MARMLRRAEEAAERRQRATVERIAREMRGLGLRAATERGVVVLSGKGVARRWLADPALRFIGRTKG